MKQIRIPVIALVIGLLLSSTALADPWVYTTPIPAGEPQPLYYKLALNGGSLGTVNAVGYQVGSYYLVVDLAWWSAQMKTGINIFTIQSCDSSGCGPIVSLPKFKWPYLETPEIHLQWKSPYLGMEE